MLRRAILVLAGAMLASNTAALNFNVRSVDCLHLDWTVELNATEWSATSNVELFFSAASIGAQTYSLLYSALPDGPVPSAGTFDLTTMFGATALNGRYAIGVELLDSTGSLIVPSASNNFIQSTATDNLVFTFSNCSAEIAAATASSTVTATSLSSTAMPTSASLTSTSRTMAATSAAPTSSAARATTAPSPTSAATIAAASSAHSNHTGAIAGGVVGGIAIVLGLLALFRFRSKRQRAQKSQTNARHHKAFMLQRRNSPKDSPELRQHDLEEGGLRPESAAANVPWSDTSHQHWSEHTPSAAHSSQSSANPFRDPAAREEEPTEIRMVQVPFQLSTPQMPQQEVPLHRVASTQMTAARGTPSPVVDTFASESASESVHATRPVSTAGMVKRSDASPPRSTFKIPRVSVPAYSITASEQREDRTPPTPAEDPFADARTMSSPDSRHH